jgi:hypothetical protein
MPALKEVHVILTELGFKKEVQNVIKPGRVFSVTYDGPNVERPRIEEMLRQVATKNEVTLSVNVEESVRFP